MAATEGELIGAWLLADATVASLVETRVYPSKPTQEPDGDHLVYYRVSGGDGTTVGGADRYTWRDVRVEAVSTTQAGAEAILKAARSCLLSKPRDLANGFQGAFARGDADEATLDDGRQVSGQTFGVRFKPV